MSGIAVTPRHRDTAILVVVAFLCALLTIAITGHRSGDNNNIFHLPILVGLYDHDGFGDDRFVQSMRFYASGFWMLLRGIASGDTALSVFLPLQVASRFLFFIGILAIGRPLGLSGRWPLSVFMLLVAVAGPLRGTAPAGDGGLLISTFTHSELANATTLIALALAMRGRFGWALAAVGVTFFINVFMAVWLALPLATMAVLALRRGTIAPRALAIQVAWGTLACVPLVVPVMWNVVSNPEFGGAVGFDYRDYLSYYYPFHFLIGATPRFALIRLGALIVACLIVGAMLESRARAALVTVVLCYVATWLVGAAISPFVHSPTILNLHLLRSSVVIVILTVVAIAALAARLATRGDTADRLFWAPLLALLLAGNSNMALLCIVIAAVARLVIPTRLVPTYKAFVAVACLCVAVKVGLAIRHSVRMDAQFRAGQREWLALSDWVRDHSSPGTVALLPVTNINPPPNAPVSSEPPPPPGAEVFEMRADRPLWVGFKEGAAVMWMPGYHARWRRRIAETLALPDLPARLGYARHHGIALVVDRCTPPGSTPAPVYRGTTLCAYAPMPATAGGVAP